MRAVGRTLAPLGVVSWGLAVGATGAAIREWDRAGPESVMRLALVLVLAALAGRAAARAAWRAMAGPGGAGAVAVSWPPPCEPPRGGLRLPRRSWPAAGGRRAVAAFALAALAGAWVAAWRLERQAQALRAWDPGRVAWVGGYVVEPPRAARFATYVVLRDARVAHVASAAAPSQGWEPLPASVEVKVPASARVGPLPRPGAWVAVRGLLRTPEDESLPGGFSLRRYLRARGVGLVVDVSSAERLAVRPGPWPAPLWVRVRSALAAAGEAAMARLRRRLTPRASAWAQAVGMGVRDALDPDEEQALQEAGLGHLLSVSGFHVGLLAGPLVAAARAVRRAGVAARVAAAALAAGSGWTYAVMSGLSAPAMRAALVQSTALASWALGRRIRPVDSLGVAAAVQLLGTNPALGGDVGFQMSYAATLGIALVAASRDGARLRAEGSRVRWSRAALGWAGDALVVSLAAWAAVSPLVALYFGRASLAGAVMSVAAAPLSGAMLWSSLASAALPDGVWALPARAADVSARALADLASLGARLEASWAVSASPGAWTLPAVAGIALAASYRGLPSWTPAGSRAPAPAAAVLGAWLVLAPSGGVEAGPAAVAAVPLGRAWVVVGRGRAGESWAWVDAAGGQELQGALQKAGAVARGLGLARVRLAVWHSRSEDHETARAPGGASARLASYWLVEGPAGLLLVRPGGEGVPVGEVQTGSVRVRAGRGGARDGAAIEVDMGAAGSVRIDPEQACLRWEPQGARACRRDGGVLLSER